MRRDRAWRSERRSGASEAQRMFTCGARRGCTHITVEMMEMRARACVYARLMGMHTPGRCIVSPRGEGFKTQ